MKLYLPIPPSSNMLFRTTKGKRYKTSKYTLWLSEAMNFLDNQNIITYGLKFIDIELYVPRLRSNSDIDNRIKPVLDLLVKYGILCDDKFVRSIYAEWLSKNEDCYVLLKGNKC